MLRLDTIPLADIINILELKSKISISKIKPTIVAIPTIFSYHQDHISTFKASIAALRVRPQSNNFVPNIDNSYKVKFDNNIVNWYGTSFILADNLSSKKKLKFIKISKKFRRNP